MSLTRRGISLVELLVALSLTGVLAVLTAGVLARGTLELRDRSEHAAREQSLRMAGGALRAALESLGQDSASGPDLLTQTAAGFTARATRIAGVLCSASPGLLVARADTAFWRALRSPVAGRDSILAARQDRSAWHAYGLLAASSGTVCPDGSGGIALPVVADSLALVGIGPGSPIRVFENVELRLYSSAPDLWIGLRLLNTAQAIQPFAGPMVANGLTLSYQKGDGTPALFPGDVAAVALRLEAFTERAGGIGLVRGSLSQADSLALFVALGNPP
jgi:type II secretory pathway pseudopilin PulG